MTWRSPDNTADEVGQLRDALETQPIIEQAKGMVMLVRGCSAEEAFAALREVSQRTNLKLHDVATVVVATGSRTAHHDLDAEATDAILAEVRRQVLGSAFDRQTGTD
ncbi:ANTAR domain-containing protein [Amycolatopsis sp. CA-126428]|uniref:ANTAR domain-containing protein n=1 Tax=Amycolatopsis sp. CA-126428 TaxID=2073158 RepID=UPI001E59128D|nr:ANTAR domain-containing protein [Amycolatopsis sp. CA-126428]